MLRIILGYRTQQKTETPVILYIGHDGDTAQLAIDSAEDELIRFAKVEGAQGFPGKRTKPAAQVVEIPAPTPVLPEIPAVEPVEVAPTEPPAETPEPVSTTAPDMATAVTGKKSK